VINLDPPATAKARQNVLSWEIFLQNLQMQSAPKGLLRHIPQGFRNSTAAFEAIAFCSCRMSASKQNIYLYKFTENAFKCKDSKHIKINFICTIKALTSRRYAGKTTTKSVQGNKTIFK